VKQYASLGSALVSVFVAAWPPVMWGGVRCIDQVRIEVDERECGSRLSAPISMGGAGFGVLHPLLSKHVSFR